MVLVVVDDVLEWLVVVVVPPRLCLTLFGLADRWATLDLPDRAEADVVDWLVELWAELLVPVVLACPHMTGIIVERANAKVSAVFFIGLLSTKFPGRPDRSLC